MTDESPAIDAAAARSRFVRVALRTPHGLLASGFGSGLSPWAPGTAGSLAAIPIWYLMAGLSIWPYLGVVFASFLVGVWASHQTGIEIGETDHGGIVWDEFVGLWIALAVIPREWPWVAAGFVLFRLFDIFKPPPVRQLERGLSGGLGVMADDVAAGLYAAALLYAAQYFISFG